jgi:hypothetical protein
LRGDLNVGSDVTLRLPLRGLFSADLSLSLAGVDDDLELSAVVEFLHMTGRLIANGASAGDSGASAAIAGSRYTIIFPMRDLGTRTPQGDGFVTGRIAAGGRARFIGETGDGQPFALTGLLQRDLTLPVGLIIDRTGNSPDYLIGHLSFGTDGTGTVGGALDWRSQPGHHGEYYMQPFVRSSLPTGARYVPPRLGTPVFNTSNGNTASLRLLDDLGTVLLNRALIFDRNDHAK